MVKLNSRIISVYKELKAPKVNADKNNISPEVVSQATAIYEKRALEAFDKFYNKQIAKLQYKELIKEYKRDFDIATRGKSFKKIVKLHTKAKVIKASKFYDFSTYVLYREKANRLSALNKELDLNIAQYKAIRNDNIHQAEYGIIEQQKAKIKAIKKQLKVDIVNAQELIDAIDQIENAKNVSAKQIEECKNFIKSEKARIKEQKNVIDTERTRLVNLEKDSYSKQKTEWSNQLLVLKATIPSTAEIEAQIKQTKENLEILEIEHKYKLFNVKNWHPDVDQEQAEKRIKRIIELAKEIRLYNIEINNKFKRLDKSFEEKINAIDNINYRQKRHYIRRGKAKAWYGAIGAKILDCLHLGLIMVLCIVGLIDHMPGVNFLLTKPHCHIGSLSICIFLALVFLFIWIIKKVIILVHRKAGIYDVVETKYSKDTSANNAINLTSSSSADEFKYLEQLFVDSPSGVIEDNAENKFKTTDEKEFEKAAKSSGTNIDKNRWSSQG